MIFSSDELVFLTLTAKCQKPFGIKFEKIKDDAADRAEAAKKQLMEKGFLTEDSITQEGIAVLKLWEAYCNATRFFIINRCIVALVDERRCIVITKVAEGYDLASGDKSNILYALLDKYEFLREGAKDNETENREIKTYTAFRERVLGFGENVLSIGVFDFKEKKKEERIFYWDNNLVYAFNPAECIEREVDAPFVRRFIFDGLGIVKGEQCTRTNLSS